MNPQEFLDLAADLIAGASEGHWRSAVSRAYYGVFLFARDLFEACHFVLPADGTIHGYLTNRLEHCRSSPLVVRVSEFRDLRRSRNWADCHNRRPFGHLLAVELCDTADALADEVKIAVSSPTIRAAMATAMADYERLAFGFTNHRPPPTVPPATP